jgi:hypothetical protein
MGLLVKLQKSIQRLLSDFKSWNQNHMRKIGLFFQNERLSIDETSNGVGTLYHFNQQPSKGKKGL